MLEYQGKVAVITGAASGIGYAIAARAAAEGMTVVPVDIDAAALAAAAASLRATGASVYPMTADVSDPESVADLARRVSEQAGDVWLYATPILHASDAATTPLRRRVLQIDYAGHELPGGLEWLRV